MATPLINAHAAAQDRSAFGWRMWVPCFGMALCSLLSFLDFVTGAFQMVALKVAAHAYPREQTAMIAGIASGAWSLLNAVLSPVIGRLFDQRLYSEAFWLVAACPVFGVIWLALSSRDGATARSAGP